MRLKEIAETGDLSRFQGFSPKPASRLGAADRSFGHLAFVLMLPVGLTVVGLYSLTSKSFDLALLNGIIQKSGVQSIFKNQTQFGIIAMASLMGALWIRLRKRGSKPTSYFQLNENI